MLRHKVLRKSITNLPKHFIIEKLARFLSRGYKQLKYIERIISGCVVGGWREMKISQCYLSYSNMKLRFSQRKTVWLFILVKLKHAKVLTFKVLHLCACCSCIEKCHLAENAYQNETYIKLCNWDNIFLCLRYSQVYKGDNLREIYFTHLDVMLKSAFML